MMKLLVRTLLFAAVLVFNPAMAPVHADTKPPAGDSSPAAKPNIVLFISDDHGYEDAGCYGAKVVRTPHLDALAKESMRGLDGKSFLPVLLENKQKTHMSLTT